MFYVVRKYFVQERIYTNTTQRYKIFQYNIIKKLKKCQLFFTYAQLRHLCLEIIWQHKDKFDNFLYICPIIYPCVAFGVGFIAVSQRVAW